MSEIEGKHQQQLRELEEAMKSTWASKAKLSEEHLEEMRRLKVEQEAAAQELKATRDRNWKLLEDKEDLELSITHLRGIVKGSPLLNDKVAAWMSLFRNVMKSEKQLHEQGTIIPVYRSALEKDCNSLIKVKNSGFQVFGFFYF